MSTVTFRMRHRLPSREARPKGRPGGITSWLVAAAAVVIASGCSGSPATPSVSLPPGVNPLVLTLVSRPVVVPTGSAILQIWGYTLYNSHGPICEPLFGTREGTRVTVRMQVSPEASGWVLRAEPGTGTAEIRFSQTGQVRPEGEVLTGSARGTVRDMTRAPGEPGRDLKVFFESSSVLEGFGSSSRPWLQGTITGYITYTDSVGGGIRCPLVYWTMQSSDGWIIPES